jgi:hypothetical protein
MAAAMTKWDGNATAGARFADRKAKATTPCDPDNTYDAEGGERSIEKPPAYAP